MAIMDQKLQSSLGEAAMGVARWIIGTPPPALILDLLLKPEFIVGIYPQGPIGKHDYLLKLRAGYAAEKLSWVLCHVVNPKMVEHNRPERMPPDPNDPLPLPPEPQQRAKEKAKAKAKRPQAKAPSTASAQ